MVEEGQPFVPEVLYKDTYYPICGRNFWDDNNGATTVCKFFGFNKGKNRITMTGYDVFAMPVGRCNPGEELTKCTAGGNAWGAFTADCKRGKRIGIVMTCTEPSMS